MSVASATITPDSGSSNVVEGGTVSLTLSATTNRAGDATKWVINPGDGSGDQEPIYIAAGQTGNFSYNYAGEENTSYHLTAKVYDMGDNCNIPPDTTPYPASFDTTVTDAPITVTGQEIDTNEGDQFSGEVAIVNDTAYNAPDGDVNRATIDWHDGTVTNGTIISLGGGNYEIDGAHSYDAAGTYSPTIMA